MPKLGHDVFLKIVDFRKNKLNSSFALKGTLLDGKTNIFFPMAYAIMHVLSLSFNKTEN